MDGRWDGRWDNGGMDDMWTVPRKTVTEGGRDGNGTWTGCSRKVDGKRSQTKDLLYFTLKFTVTVTVIRHFNLIFFQTSNNILKSKKQS